VPLLVAAAPGLDADQVFGPAPPPVWREHAGPGGRQHRNEEESAPAGSYRLEVACLGDAVSASINDGPARRVECDGSVAGLSYCLRHAGPLRATATAIRGPVADMVWQLVREHRSCA
jgi:hypothetical protein